jgi:hypothetical protein
VVATLDVEQHESNQTRLDKTESKEGDEVGAAVGSIEVYGTGYIQFTGALTRSLTTLLKPQFQLRKQLFGWAKLMAVTA